MSAELGNSNRRRSSDPQVIDLFQGQSIGGKPAFMEPNSDASQAGFLTPANIAGIEQDIERQAESIEPTISAVLVEHGLTLEREALHPLSRCIATSQPYAELLPMLYQPCADPDWSVVSLLVGEGSIRIPTAAIKQLAEATGVTFVTRPPRVTV